MEVQMDVPAQKYFFLIVVFHYISSVLWYLRVPTHQNLQLGVIQVRHRKAFSAKNTRNLQIWTQTDLIHCFVRGSSSKHQNYWKTFVRATWDVFKAFRRKNYFFPPFFLQQKITSNIVQFCVFSFLRKSALFHKYKMIFWTGKKCLIFFKKMFSVRKTCKYANKEDFGQKKWKLMICGT